MLRPFALRVGLLAAVFACVTATSAQQKPKPKVDEGPYPVNPDSENQAGVAQGTVTQGQFSDSKIYPGTQRDYWVYVPAQHDESKPAALMVFQDGAGYRDTVATVFDNPGARAFDRAVADRGAASVECCAR